MTIPKTILLTAGTFIASAALTMAALLKCPDCGSTVSSRASACPKCGCPATQMQQTPETAPAAVPQPGTASFQHARNALVIVETKKGSGSGFVASFDGVLYVLTNAHVLDDCNQLKLKTLDGQELRFATIEFADTKDLARIQLLEPPPTLTPLTIATAPVGMSQAVAVYGNSLGSGVATELKGRILGVGPEKIEVDAEFVRGNSGSPILDARGQVIGVATFVTRTAPGTDWVADNTRFTMTRRFGLRLDKTTWVKVLPDDLRAQLGCLSDVDTFLVDALTLVPNWLPVVDSQYRSIAREYLETYSASERKKDYISAGWAEAIERFCDVYVALAQNDREWNRRSKMSRKSFTYQGLARERDATFPSLAKRARGVLANTKWSTTYLKEEAASKKEILDFLDECIEKCQTGEKWAREEGWFNHRRNIDGVLK